MAQPPSEIRQYNADSLWSFYPGNRYSWFHNGNILTADTNRAIRPLVSGSYTVSYRTDSCNSVLSPPYVFFVTGIPESFRTSQCLQVQNPFGEQLFLRWNCITTGTRELTLMNYLGQIIHHERLALTDDFTVILDASQWPPGLYSMVVDGPEGLHTLRLLRQ
jgi:hypothetical protein